jgi:hypothetical protein
MSEESVASQRARCRADETDVLTIRALRVCGLDLALARPVKTAAGV